MNSNYLAQRLVNEGKIAVSSLRPLLKDIRDRDPQLPLMALKMHMLTGEQLLTVDTSSSSAFGKDVLQKNLLTNDQLQRLHRQMPGESLRFAQSLIDNKVMDYPSVEREFDAYEADVADPIDKVIATVGATLSREEREIYGSYVKLLMDQLIDFLHTPVVIDPQPFAQTAELFDGLVYEVSQHIAGDVSFVGGLVAKEAAFIELSARYSQEDLTAVDDLAIDSLEEFLNVINGLFCIQLAGRNQEAELGLPRWNKNIVPHGNNQLLLNIYADFGTFVAVLAADEFM